MSGTHLLGQCRCDSCELEFTKRAIREEFPKFKMIPKSESSFMRKLDWCLRVVTFGKMTSFMQMTTTINMTVYLADDWDNQSKTSQEEVLLHERVHLRQVKKHGFLLFAFLYLFFPLPMFFAYYRTKFEQEAYEESMRYIASIHGIKELERPVYRVGMTQRFTGPTYGWMWCDREDIESWYARTVARLYLEQILNSKSS